MKTLEQLTRDNHEEALRNIHAVRILLENGESEMLSVDPDLAPKATLYGSKAEAKATAAVAKRYHPDAIDTFLVTWPALKRV